VKEIMRSRAIEKTADKPTLFNLFVGNYKKPEMKRLTLQAVKKGKVPNTPYKYVA
jgi:hypothetical protein